MKDNSMSFYKMKEATHLTQQTLSSEQCDALLKTLEKRFNKNMHRHEGIEWGHIQTKLEANKDELWSLNEMEQRGGEPEGIDYDKETDTCAFYACSTESSRERRNACYDRGGIAIRQ